MSEAENNAPGTWEFVSSEGFDDYMKAIGVGMATRLAAKALKPTNEITIQDGLWTIKTISTFRTNVISFKLGEQFDENSPDGKKLQTLCTVEGNKLIQKQEGEYSSVITRTFDADTFVVQLEAKDAVCTRHYKRKAK